MVLATSSALASVSADRATSSVHKSVSAALLILGSHLVIGFALPHRFHRDSGLTPYSYGSLIPSGLRSCVLVLANGMAHSTIARRTTRFNKNLSKLRDFLVEIRRPVVFDGNVPFGFS